MKYYSEETRDYYDSAEECEKAEKNAIAVREAEEQHKKELADTRATRAKEVEAAYERYLDAGKEYNKLLHDFLRDYQSYHMTIRRPGMFDLLDWAFGF